MRLQPFCEEIYVLVFRIQHFNYHPSVGNYIRNGNYLRWNGNTLSDPDGYYNMTADQILYDLFGK